MKTNRILFYSLVTGLTLGFLGEVKADSDCQNGEQNCWPCGENCTARFDASTHTMTYSGTGDMYQNMVNSTTPWIGISSQIHNVVVEEGITSLQPHFLHNWYLSTGNITSISLPSTLTKIGDAAFARLSSKENQINSLVIPENVTEWGESVFYHSYGNIYCPVSQINNCNKNNNGSSRKVSIASYEHKDGLYYVYDSNGNIDEIYDNYQNFSDSVKKGASERLSQKDENGNIITYDEKGRMVARYSSNSGLTKYVHNSDGSVAVYNKDGKLIGLKGKRILTVDEAASLVSGKNTFTLRYR